ncbi:MAG: hypothetical protein ACU0B7_03470 [Paracoccaceae bacterium]
MKIDVKMDVHVAARMLERIPKELKTGSDEFIERVGRKLERNAKYAMRANVAGPGQARSRTGNLARHIIFHEPSQSVEAHANYSKYVHGAPYYQFKMKRKVNPFFTTALETSNSFINQEAHKMIRKVIKQSK